jgi:PAS domain S-box-containing protein
MMTHEEICCRIVTAVPDGVWVVDPQGRTIFNNKRMAEILGADTGSLSEQSCFECVFPENLVEAQRQFAQGMAGNRQPFDFRLRRNDGSAIWVSISCGPICDASGVATGLLGLFSEITDRKLEEAKLRESEDRFRNMADDAPVLLWMSGRDKLCNFFNRGWLEFTGRTMEAEVGNGWADGVYPQDLERCMETYYSAFDARRPFEVEYRLRRYDGKYRWILDKGVPRHACNGEFIGYIGSCIDIEDRKRIEELSSELAHMQRLAIIGELTAAITHEVRQPLGAMLLYTTTAEELLKSASPPLDKIREIISDVRKSLSHANDVIERTRGLSRKDESLKRPVDVNATILDALKISAVEAGRRSVQIRTELTSQLPPVPCDRTQLQQILLNLITNAMDAMAGTPPAERQLTLRSEPIGDDGVEVLVIDRGAGIARDKLSHLFESYFTTKAAGIGLGLSIARTLVAKHGGRIWAENNSQGGATFHFTLSAARDQPTGATKLTS